MARPRKNINIRLVAEEAGVSVATVSRVVNNRTDVSEAVRRRVAAVIDRVNFLPTKSFDRRMNIGVMVALETPLISDYVSLILDGVSTYSTTGSVDVTVMLYRVGLEGKPLLQTIRERRCDAVIIVPGEPVAEQLEELRRAEIPVMLINGSMTGPKMGCIGTEAYAGGVKAMRYLIQCGHRRIGFLCNVLQPANNHSRRLQAYRDVLSEYGIEPRPEWVVAHHPTEQTSDAGYDQCCTLLRQAPEVTAVFCTNDGMAIGAIKACWDAGRRVPEDVSVIGFDGIACGKYLHPALTTVCQPLVAIGHNAVRYLDEFLRGERTVLPNEVLDTELVIRDSVALIHENDGDNPGSSFATGKG